MGITYGYNILRDALLGWIPFEMTWLMYGITILITIIMLTRDMQKAKEIALPISIGWLIIWRGHNVDPGMGGYLIMFILGIIFVLEHISITQMTELLTTATRGITTYYDKTMETYGSLKAKKEH